MTVACQNDFQNVRLRLHRESFVQGIDRKAVS